uniref:Uncharacterized protein n=1 Tax=Lepeophtheirus salmonis TaxID=72036 RepID=A0A0K2U3J6_LEPSM
MKTVPPNLVKRRLKKLRYISQEICSQTIHTNLCTTWFKNSSNLDLQPSSCIRTKKTLSASFVKH